MQDRARIRLQEILKEIHRLTTGEESSYVKRLRTEAHDIIRKASISYFEAYSLFRQHTSSDAEFNAVMGRIRKTMLDSGKV